MKVHQHASATTSCTLPHSQAGPPHELIAMPCSWAVLQGAESAPALLMGRGVAAAEPSSAVTLTASLAAGLQAHAEQGG